MRKIVAGLFMAANGVVEKPETWQFPYFDEELGAALGASMAAADTLLLGRRTYEEFARYWPHQASDVPIADYMNNTPKLVVSTTLQSVDWQNSTLINRHAFAELRKLKEAPGKNINITGSPTLVASLIGEDLLDELHLLVHPVVVGSGRHLFDGRDDRIGLRLVESKTFGSGVQALTYVAANQERPTS
jgi:dihydrofolate reductase